MPNPLQTHPADRLLHPVQPSLSGWYGEPLTAAAAADLYGRARQDLRTRLSGDRPAFALYVLQMVCDFWQHDGVPCNRMLPDASGNRRDQALLELVRGQLLMTRKLQPANRHLQRGFELAAPWLGTTGYFELLRRHELLACLRLADTPSPPQGLAALQAEAAVVRRLRGEPRCRSAGTHCDTLG